MKAESQLFFPSFTALVLKLAGVILILVALVNSLLTAIPPDFLNSEWLTKLISAWVNQGTIPMLGVALLFLGVWVSHDTGADSSSQNSRKGLLYGSVALATLLGLVFLVLAPLYFNSSRLTSAAKTRDVNTQATQAESQLNGVLEQQRSQVNALITNGDKLAQVKQGIENSQLPEDQKTQLKQLQQTLQQVKDDPKLLDKKVEEARSQGLGKIHQQQQQAIEQVKAEVRKSRMQVGFGSLSLAIGYFVIAWTGLRMSSPTQRRSQPRRNLG